MTVAFANMRRHSSISVFSSSLPDLIQNVRENYDYLPELTTWKAFLCVILFLCIATRLLTGLRSRRRNTNSEVPWRVKIAPYYLPWIGHVFSLARDHLNCVIWARFVLPFAETRWWDCLLTQISKVLIQGSLYLVSW